MFKQCAAVLGIAVIRSGFLKNAEIPGLLNVGSCAGNQPERVIPKAAADFIVALLGQRLILVIAPAVAELRCGNIQNPLPGSFRDLMDKSQKILGRISEAHAAADAALKHGGGPAHVEGDHALIRIPDIDHAGEFFILRLQLILSEQGIPVCMQFLERFLDLFIGVQAGKDFLRRLFVDDARCDELFFLGQFAVSQDKIEGLLFAGSEMHTNLMGSHRLPAGSHRIAHLSGQHTLWSIKAVVQSEECLHVGIKAVHGHIDSIECIVIAAFTVFRLVVNHAIFHFDFAG